MCIVFVRLYKAITLFPISTYQTLNGFVPTSKHTLYRPVYRYVCIFTRATLVSAGTVIAVVVCQSVCLSVHPSVCHKSVFY